MVRLNVNEFNLFLRLLEDETARHQTWIDTGDYASPDELRTIEEDLLSLSSTLDEMKLKKQRLLTLLR